MKEGCKLTITNLDRVPGRKITDTLGMAYGYACVKEKENGKVFQKLDGKERKWSETPEDFEALIREAESRLARSGKKMGADGVVRLEGRFSRNDHGLAEVHLMGTAVKLDISDEQEKETEALEGSKDAEGDSISFQIDGEEVNWKPPQATTPRIEALKKMRDRGIKDVRSYDEDKVSILAMAQEIGIPLDRAKLLIDNGFDRLTKLAEAGSKDISAVEGINPTQARIIRQKAREMLAED
ncbi:MAG: heavy metal-binding domain-containing protein [Candidatus Thermoplasmatota archaeon]|nr:heavy metal-binding domain-containing protein [Candidatus Thermoplasmatota archaeon]